ncbi:MAG: hypothetical protein ACOC1F_01365 [Myxococcota bacterium]
MLGTLPTSEHSRLAPLAKQIVTFLENKDTQALVLMMPPAKREGAKAALQPGSDAYKDLFGRHDGVWHYGSIQKLEASAFAAWGEAASGAALL